MNPKVDFYFNKDQKWQEAIGLLRTMALACGLNEELKWGCPSYTQNGNNIVLIHVFKDYCAYLFFKGALMDDPNNILVQQTENVQSARQVRFTNAVDIEDMKAILQAYINNAVEVEKAGLKVELKKTLDFSVTPEFQQKLDSMPMLKTAFESLTPGRQRNYLLHFSQPKQSATRESRIEKCMLQILAGKGLND